LVAYGFDQGSQYEVFGAAQQAFAAAHDEGERVGGEGVVAESGAGNAKGVDAGNAKGVEALFVDLLPILLASLF
jgi:hypothetical protein